MIIESNTPRTDAAVLVGTSTLNQGEYVEASFAQTLERELAQALIPPTDPAVESSDLVAAGDGLVAALVLTEAQMDCPCGCGDFSPCKRCTKARVEGQAATEAWKEAKANPERPPSLSGVLDDGQEVRMFKLMGAGKGYCVTIHGDCVCQSRSKTTLEAAIREAVEKYEANRST